MTANDPVSLVRKRSDGKEYERCGNRIQVDDEFGQPITPSNPFPVELDQSNIINPITLGDTAAIDAFARLRVSNPFTLFDSKQVSDEQLPFYWDDQEVSGGGTGSAYDADFAETVLSVSNTTAGKRVRQTKRRFNYQPGKSQLSFITFVLNAGSSGITKQVGMFDDDNGIFLRQDDGVLYLVIRSSTSGAAVDTAIAQANWNLDTFDGTGDSGITLDQTRAQILLIDYEWLGVGRVRVGFVVDGIPVYAHEFLHANVIGSVYMTTPNLPVRYTIENDGTGGAASLDCICSSIISEGGFEPYGVLRTAGTGNLLIDANVAGTFYAIVGIRLKADCLGADVKLESVNMITATADNFYWEIRWNPTVAGTFVYGNLTNSVIQAAIGDTGNTPSNSTVTGGIALLSGYGSDRSREVALPLDNAVKLGANIAGTVDELVLCVTPCEGDSNLDIFGGINWREVI